MGPVAFVTFYSPPYGGGVGGEAFSPSPFGEGRGGAFTSHTLDSAPT